MGTMLEKLNEYGADVQGAMERFLGDEELYEACFMVFLADEAFPLLGEALALKDYTQAFEAAHTLKGVAGNMGLTPIYNLICGIVDALRAKDYSDLQTQYAEINNQLSKLKAIQG
ncbi:MAG: Hpt domain-containing protein [Oscillospiraceae bacterium]